MSLDALNLVWEVRAATIAVIVHKHTVFIPQHTLSPDVAVLPWLLLEMGLLGSRSWVVAWNLDLTRFRTNKPSWKVKIINFPWFHHGVSISRQQSRFSKFLAFRFCNCSGFRVSTFRDFKIRKFLGFPVFWFCRTSCLKYFQICRFRSFLIISVCFFRLPCFTGAKFRHFRLLLIVAFFQGFGCPTFRFWCFKVCKCRGFHNQSFQVSWFRVLLASFQMTRFSSFQVFKFTGCLSTHLPFLICW